MFVRTPSVPVAFLRTESCSLAAEACLSKGAFAVEWRYSTAVPARSWGWCLCTRHWLPQPQLHCCPRLGIGCRAHAAWHLGKRRVGGERAGEQRNDGIGRPDASDMWKPWRLLFFGRVGVVLVIVTVKQCAPHAGSRSRASSGRLDQQCCPCAALIERILSDAGD